MGIVAAVVVMPGLALLGATGATAAIAPVATGPSSAAGTVTAAPVTVSSLRATGARVDLTVRRIHTSGQARWVDHVVDENLTGSEGCVADPSDSTRRGSTYRMHVNFLCSGGNLAVRQSVARLQASRPWYRMTVTPVRVVAFQFLADLDHGTGDAVNAALDHLPFNDFTFVDGDDVSMTYVGTGVTQAELDAAHAAFARALRIPATRVAVSPLNWS